MGIFKQPKVSQPEPIKVKDVEAEAQKKAAEEAEKLRKGRVKTILTTGQGITESNTQRKTVLGG